MKYLQTLYLLVQSLVAMTYAAPVIPAALTIGTCINPDEFKEELFTKLHDDLGAKFTKDFDEAYKLTLKLSQFSENDCYDYMEGKFLCTALHTVYGKRIPEAADTIAYDCEDIIEQFYAPANNSSVKN